MPVQWGGGRFLCDAVLSGPIARAVVVCGVRTVLAGGDHRRRLCAGACPGACARHPAEARIWPMAGENAPAGAVAGGLVLYGLGQQLFPDAALPADGHPADDF